MRKLLRWALLLLGALLLALVLWQLFALFRAHQRTPDVLKAAAVGELRLPDLTPQRRTMLLKVEDPGFYRHKGVDFATPGQGATSITQGLVKKFYFDNFKPGFAKIEQSLIARFVLDPAMSKDDQLHAYLNYTYFGRAKGRQVIGYAEASRAYFGRPFAQLSDQQFLSLLAMTIAPNELDPIRHTTENRERVRRIERLLAGKCQPAGVTDNHYPGCA